VLLLRVYSVLGILSISGSVSSVPVLSTTMRKCIAMVRMPPVVIPCLIGDQHCFFESPLGRNESASMTSFRLSKKLWSSVGFGWEGTTTQ